MASFLSATLTLVKVLRRSFRGHGTTTMLARTFLAQYERSGVELSCDAFDSVHEWVVVVKFFIFVGVEKEKRGLDFRIAVFAIDL